jgi:hypothetical protein
MTHSPYYIPYVLQQKITKKIIQDADGKEYRLKRVGLYDKFEENYAQNYIYLLWWYGNEPQKDAKITYTIYESSIPNKVKNNNMIKKYSISNIILTKEVK